MPNNDNRTRREFLVSALKLSSGGLLLSSLVESIDCPQALAKKAPRAQNPFAGVGPRTLFKEEWPPAILPAHVGMADKGYLCFTDDFGRLAVVDMRKPAPGKPPFKVISSLGGLGNKVIDFAITPYAAYGVVFKENDNHEPVVTLVSVSLVPITEPTILSELAIPRLADASCIAAAGDLICLAGTGGNAGSGENIVSIFSAPSRHTGSKEPGYIASLTLKQPVRAMELSDKQLTILSSDPYSGKSQIDYVLVSNASSPEIQSSVQIEGDFRVLTKFKDLALVAGYKPGSRQGKGGCQAKSVTCGVNARVVSTITLDPLLSIESASAQKDRFVVVGRSAGKRNLISLVLDRNHALLQEQVLDLKTSKTESTLPAQGSAAVIYREPLIYIASGWSGVQMLTRSKEGFNLTTSYNIPRLAASGVASFGNNVVLAGADLQLYNISRPERPMLMSQAEPPSSLKSVIGALSSVLCLSKDDLSLRPMNKLDAPSTQVKLQASHICFDPAEQEHRCYAIKSGDKSTKVTRYKVYKDSMVKEFSQDVPGSFTHCQAYGGQLVLAGLSDLTLLGPADQSGPREGDSTDGKASDSKSGSAVMSIKGSRHFDNLAVRDVAITDGAIVATAVDKDTKGFFLVLGANNNLNTIGSIDLPHNGVAVAASGKRAVAVGQSADGKDVAAVVNFEQESAPRVTATLNVLEGVSSVSIKDSLAILAGRGLEIVNL